MKKLRTSCMAAACAAALIAGAPAAIASTPDGATPANEGVCDGLLNATAGLYGVCVAYCEAQDCDFDGSVSGQCEPPDPRLLDVYDGLAQPGDPPMPCTSAPCPCFSETEIQEVEPPFVTCGIDTSIGLNLVSTIRNGASPEEFAVVTDSAAGADSCQIRFNTATGWCVLMHPES